MIRCNAPLSNWCLSRTPILFDNFKAIYKLRVSNFALLIKTFTSVELLFALRKILFLHCELWLWHLGKNKIKLLQKLKTTEKPKILKINNARYYLLVTVIGHVIFERLLNVLYTLQLFFYYLHLVFFSIIFCRW